MNSLTKGIRKFNGLFDHIQTDFVRTGKLDLAPSTLTKLMEIKELLNEGVNERYAKLIKLRYSRNGKVVKVSVFIAPSAQMDRQFVGTLMLNEEQWKFLSVTLDNIIEMEN